MTTASERLRRDFGSTSSAYAESTHALKRAWDRVHRQAEAQRAFRAWRSVSGPLDGSGTHVEAVAPTDDLALRFLRQSYLAVLVRLVVWSGMARGEALTSPREVLFDCLTGDWFRRRRIGNLVAPGPFQWVCLPAALDEHAATWEGCLHALRAGQYASSRHDVFTSIYQDLIASEDRHDLGEHYTPEWLCERLVAELLPARGIVKVIDPTCGSGNFLRAVIAHYVRSNPERRRDELLEEVLHGVVGLDVHPLAATIARASYVLALGSLIEGPGQPIQVPVRRANVLRFSQGDGVAGQAKWRRHFSGQFDLVLGNPPWLAYRHIADEDDQSRIKRCVIDDYGLAPRRQQLVTQMELATVFLAHALTVFGRPGATLAFVMPRSVLTADQHETFRLQTHTAPMAITAYWDLRDVRPLFNVPACVIFAERSEEGRARRTPDQTIPAQEWTGRLPERDLSWNEAEGRLAVKKTRGRIVTLGGRNAFAIGGAGSHSTDASPYRDQFRQGATIVPRNFYFVEVDWRDVPFRPDRVYQIKTDPEQARTAKKPYNALRLVGQAEGRFLFKTAIARHVLPFLVLEPADIVLPVTLEEGRPKVWTARALKEEGHRDVGDWMAEAEALWERHRGPKAERSTLGDWLDYGNKLSKQDVTARYVVLYNAAGTNISAAVFDRGASERAFFVDAKLYWFATRTLREADYLAAVLNAESVNDLIKPFQSVGLHGERDIHKKVLDLPIPRFNPDDPLHRELSSLGATSRELVGRWRATQDDLRPASLARHRAQAREAARTTLGPIETLVRKLVNGP